MKTLLCAIALVLGLARADATTFHLTGDLTWQITEPRCTFKLDGDLQNVSAGGSGTLKLVLWATPAPFPSVGYLIAERTIGPLDSGAVFSDFTVKTPSSIPSLSGNYYFTIALAEYTAGGWRNVLAVPTGTQNLQLGNFPGQLKWALPKKPITPAFALIQAGDVITLKSKATDLLNLFPTSPALKTTLKAVSDTQLTAKTTAGKRTPKYKYQVVKSTYLNKKVSAGQLTLEYPAAGGSSSSTTVLTFYFQGGASGVYKSVETNPPETTWGTFTFGGGLGF